MKGRIGVRKKVKVEINKNSSCNQFSLKNNFKRGMDCVWLDRTIGKGLQRN
jgi:hypothetical protein